jgi:hypothetical protein
MSCLPWIRTALIGELYRPASSVGIPRLRDGASARPVHVLGIDHPTPRTRRTGETILMVDRADAHYVTVGRLWTLDERRALGSGLRTRRMDLSDVPDIFDETQPDVAEAAADARGISDNRRA